SDEHIRDVYLDTQDNTLRSRGIGVRVRHKNREVWLTLKADEQRGAWGVRRHEREVPWSSQGLALLAADLKGMGVQVTLPVDTSGASDAVAALTQSGLVRIQERETFRRIRRIQQPNRDETAAELALDSCAYHLHAGEVRTYEVEVELKAGDAALLQQLNDAVRARFPGGLRAWPYSKLATGIALEQLLHERGRADILDQRDNLKSEACPALEAILEQQANRSYK
ncbi:MAG: CYTH domain-containing protein, partial [Chloroflexi bacterium]